MLKETIEFTENQKRAMKVNFYQIDAFVDQNSAYGFIPHYSPLFYKINDM